VSNVNQDLPRTTEAEAHPFPLPPQLRRAKQRAEDRRGWVSH